MALKFWGKFVAGPLIAAAGVAQLFVRVAWLAWLREAYRALAAIQDRVCFYSEAADC